MFLTVAQKLPNLWKLACEIAEEIKADRYSDWPPLVERMQPLLNPEFIETINRAIPGWKNIATLHNGQTAKHTLMVLVTCLNLPEYSQAGAQTRLEIEWAALLHDLDKKFARTDTAHPFRSAAVVAPLMPALGFDLQPGLGSDDVEKWSALVMSALRADGERMIHDHAHLSEIVAGMRKLWGEKTPALHVMKAILFHQSLPTVTDWSNAVLLTEAEIRASLTSADMDVLAPLLIADSDSWNIFDEPRYAYLEELHANIAATRRIIGV